MRNPFPIIWLAVKFLVSLFAATGGLVVVYFTLQTTGIGSSRPWILLAIAMFLAVAPWVFSKPQNPRAVALTCIFMGLGTLLFAAVVPFVPEDCSGRLGRSHSSCVVFNWLYSIGGQFAVSTFFVSAGLFLFAGGFFLLKRRVRHA